MLKILGILFAFGLVLGLLGIAIEFLVEILVVIVPYVTAVGFIAMLCWTTWIIVKYFRKKKNAVPVDLDSLIRKTNSPSASTKQELNAFLSENALVRSFHTRVVGVSYNNDDGSSRQVILSQCLRGEPLGLYWHKFEGKPACAVISDHGQIGYLNAELADDLNYNYHGDRYSFVSHISDVTGGEDGLYYGCIISISIYESSDV